MPDSKIQDQFAARVSTEEMTTTNVLNFGGAATSLALILLLAQTGIDKQGQALSLACASVAMPFWVALALGNVSWASLTPTLTSTGTAGCVT